MIKLTDPLQAYINHKAEIDRLISDVLASGQYVIGDAVAEFEQTFAAYLGIRHVVAVNSGSDAIEIGLRSNGIGPGDEVITVSHTALATVASIMAVGAHPVLVDVEPNSRCICPKSVERAVSTKTKAIVAVHIYGQPANIKALQNVAAKNNLKLIEDCAQSAGAAVGSKKVGTFGDLAAFSFYPTKNLGAFGDGGAIATDSGMLAEKARRIRQYGWDSARKTEYPGRNSRLDEVQASVLNYRLNQLDQENNRRREIAARYCQQLACLDQQLQVPSTYSDRHHVYHLFVCTLSNETLRDPLSAFLENAGIQAGVHYPVPVHEESGYQEFVSVDGDKLPQTESLGKRIISLPMHPALSDEEVDTVCTEVIGFFKKYEV